MNCKYHLHAWHCQLNLIKLDFFYTQYTSLLLNQTRSKKKKKRKRLLPFPTAITLLSKTHPYVPVYSNYESKNLPNPSKHISIRA